MTQQSEVMKKLRERVASMSAEEIAAFWQRLKDVMTDPDFDDANKDGNGVAQ